MHIYDKGFKYTTSKEMGEDYLQKKFKRIQREQAKEAARKTYKQMTQDLQEKREKQREIVRRELRRIA